MDPRVDSRTTFRFEAGEVRFELTGSEDFVRRNLPSFLPFVERVVSASKIAGHDSPVRVAPSSSAPVPAAGHHAAAPAAAAAAVAAAPANPIAGTGTSKATDPNDLTGWWNTTVGKSTRVSMQDTILVLAYWMRGFRKFIFTSEDIRRGFDTLGQDEPKSLLQILGTLKRDHNLILGTERRGEYMLNTTGIERVRQLIGAPGRSGARDESGGAMSDGERAARALQEM